MRQSTIAVILIIGYNINIYLMRQSTIAVIVK